MSASDRALRRFILGSLALAVTVSDRLALRSTDRAVVLVAIDGHGTECISVVGGGR